MKNAALRRAGQGVVVDEDEAGTRVVELILRLTRGERRVDRCRDGAEAPGGGDRDEKFDPVGQERRDDVAASDSECVELLGCGVDSGGKARVVEFGVVVADAWCGCTMGQLPGKIRRCAHDE